MDSENTERLNKLEKELTCAGLNLEVLRGIYEQIVCEEIKKRASLEKELMNEIYMGQSLTHKYL